MVKDVLLHPHPVKTYRIVSPPCISEIGGTAGEGVGGQWKPRRWWKVRAGFNQDRLADRPINVETELVALVDQSTAAAL